MANEPLTLNLYPKQAMALNSEANLIMFGGSCGSGKLAEKSLVIHTLNRGKTTMGDIQVGDVVFDKDGNPCDVIAKSEVDYDEQAYEVTFNTGEVVIVGASHDWLALDKDDRRYNYKRNDEYRAKRRAKRPSRAKHDNLHSRVLSERNARVAEEKRKAEALLKPIFGRLVNTQQMFETQEYLVINKNSDIQVRSPNWAIGVCGAVNRPKPILHIDPYVLGVWLGDGCSTNAQIANGDKQIVDYIASVYDCTVTPIQKEKRNGELGEEHWRVSIRKFKALLECYDLVDNKHIPDVYMKADRESRLRLLNGIMDTDGYVEKNKAYITQVRFDLIKQIRELACSLGIKCSAIRSKEPFYTKNSGERVYCKTAYTFALCSLFNPFTLERKRQEWDKYVSKKLKDEYYRLIVSIKPVENPGMQCIQVNSPDNTYLITDSFIPTHNSFLIRAASIIYAIEIPGISIYVFRKNYADLLANHLTTGSGYLQLLDNMLQTKLVTYNKSEYCFSFANGSRIQLAHLNYESDLTSYQGREIQCCFLDESTQFSAYSIQFIMSRLRLGALHIPDKWKGKFPRMILLTNPGGVSHDWHKSRFVDFGTEIHQHPPEWGGMIAQYIPALLTDNKILCENDPTYADKIRGLSIDSPELVEAMLNGNWDISSSNAVTHWKREIHVIEPFAIPKTWKLFPSYDWGYSAPYGVLWIAVSNGEDYIDANGETQSAPQDSIFVVAEIYGATPDGKGLKEEPSVTAKRVKEINESFEALGLKVSNGPCDNSCFNKDRGKSIASIFAENGVVWTRSNKAPGSRVLGLQLINQMVYNATMNTPEGPILKVFKTCPYLAKQLPALQRDKNKPEDIDTKSDDHLADCLKYSIFHTKAHLKQKPVGGL